MVIVVVIVKFLWLFNFVYRDIFKVSFMILNEVLVFLCFKILLCWVYLLYWIWMFVCWLWFCNWRFCMRSNGLRENNYWMYLLLVWRKCFFFLSWYSLRCWFYGVSMIKFLIRNWFINFRSKFFYFCYRFIYNYRSIKLL